MRILTGIKPTGEIHLGNYIGAIRPILRSEGHRFCLIADYHAMTSDGSVSRENINKLIATLIALDPKEKLFIYRQSEFPELHELAWYLSCNTSSGILNRGHAVKAAEVGGNRISNGTMFYPLLMTADILALQADKVTVGKDQLQHLQISRDIAQSFNYNYGDIFKLPEASLIGDEPIINVDGTQIARSNIVLGLDGRKMSKSYGNTIPLMADKKVLRQLIMSIATDSTPLEDPKNPELCTVFSLYQNFASDDQIRIMHGLYCGGHFGYGHAKVQLAEAIELEIEEARQRYHEILSDPNLIKDRLEIDAVTVKPIISKTLGMVREVIFK